MNNKEHAKNLLDTMPIVNRSASIMNAGSRSRFNSPTQMGHSPAEMSPLKEKNFPVKPGMKLSDFEELIDKRTGEKVSKEALNVAEGTDLSHLEGVTNLSQLASGGLRSEANISNRVNAGQYKYNREGGYSVPVDDFAREGMTTTDNPNYPRVNLDVDRGLEFDAQTGEVSSFDLGKNYQSKEKKLNRVKSDLQKMIRSHNVRSSARKEEGSYPNVALPNNRPGILETDANRPRTAANEDIYTTARLGNRSDADIRGTTHSMVGITGNPSVEKTTSYFTQRNRNMPETFTTQSLKNSISQNPQRFYAPVTPNTRLYDRKTGNIPSLSNIKDNYTHLDFTGNLQRPNDRFARVKESQAVNQDPNIRGRSQVRTSRDFNEPR